MFNSRKAALGLAVTGAVIAAGTVAVAASRSVTVSGAGPDAASLNCPGGMTRLGHPFDEHMSIFPFDPAIHVAELYSVAGDGFKVEDIDTGAHAGTHIDVPAHFIDGGRTLDELAAEEFVWPVYKMDVRGLDVGDDLLIERSDIETYEAANGMIPPGALVVLQTGAEEFFGLGGDGDEYRLATKENGQGGGQGRILKPYLADNVDDLFEFENAGFSFDAVQWLFDERFIDGVGSDAYGPDAATDPNFDATFATLFNDGIALVALANLDSVAVNGDIIMAPTVNLTEGSGFSVDPLACHGAAGID